jgi:SAM-dependent methyltransferase
MGLESKAMGRMTLIAKYCRALKQVTLAVLLFVSTAFFFLFILGAMHFPYDVDVPLNQEEIEAARKYYAEAYQRPVRERQGLSEYETEYVRVAEAAAKKYRIEEQVTAFVQRFNLNSRPVLEIGSGRGYLQDMARDYTGLDISPAVSRFYHKKFVLGSATAMPFADDSFDGVWSIWVFEHVPNPEQAFQEARRVIRDKGVFFLYPAWNCVSWAAEGYEVRPYSDFGPVGKLIKVSVPLRSSWLFRTISLMPIRIVRRFVAGLGPTKLRYRRLTPNYERYWVADSDAVNSIDRHEAMLWFVSRGDECLNCDDGSVLVDYQPLIIRVHKQGSPPASIRAIDTR